MTNPPAASHYILTVGHGTLRAEEFAKLLVGAGIDRLVDVRRYPGSRRFPHFGAEAMEAWLPTHGLDYLAVPSLGGRRRPTDDRTNAAWRNPQFRAYADHMASGEYRSGIEELRTAWDTARLLAVMCSEAVWWRCHRRLLADHLEIIERVPVQHLFHDGRLARHPPAKEARADSGRVVYPAS